MLPEELLTLIDTIEKGKYETQTIEVKAAFTACPKRLYDTLSSFSNQDGGGIIVFGLDESSGFEKVGVYDAQDLQKHIAEQCEQMTPPVRAQFTVAECDGKYFVSAEIPGLDITDRPCFYAGKGRLVGSYVRVGDNDIPMTEHEIYSYEAFRKKYQDDIRPIEAGADILDTNLLSEYITALKKDKPNIRALSDETIMSLYGIIRDGKPTLYSILLFGLYPQAQFPQLTINAVVVPGIHMGDVGDMGERFSDNVRIEGNLRQMIDDAVAFVRRNMKMRTVIRDTGEGVIREDTYDYPVTAVREAIINAVAHRDYSIHTEGMPITLTMYDDRMVIKNPGGLYGRMRLDNLGKMQPDTRNPKLVTAMEIMKLTENRYSGIPTMRREMKAAGLAEPEFSDIRDEFSVCFRKDRAEAQAESAEERIKQFCSEYRTRDEIAHMLGLGTAAYAVSKYIRPLVERGVLIEEKPSRSHNQRYKAKQ